jgi:hypothetical protein
VCELKGGTQKQRGVRRSEDNAMWKELERNTEERKEEGKGV